MNNVENSPKISVVIPTRNRADYLKQAIDSVLEQDYDNLEIVVADNASSDGTETLLEHYRDVAPIRYRRLPTNVGMVANWADAIENHSTGDWFVIMSDDDYFIDNHYISRAVRHIRENPSLMLVMSNGYLRHEKTGEMLELRLPFKGFTRGIEVFLSRGTVRPQDFTLCNILFRRSTAIELSPFRDQHNIACDSELFLKLCLLGDVAVCDSLASVYRIHGSNLLRTTTTEKAVMLASLQAVLRPYLMAISLLEKEEIECSAHDLTAWRQRVLVSHARFILWHGLYARLAKKRELYETLNEMLPGIADEALASARFRLKLLMLGPWRWLNRLQLPDRRRHQDG